MNPLVSMLPSINAENRSELSNNSILVGKSLDRNRPRLRVLHDPCPSTALDARQRGVEFLLERIQTAKVRVDCLGQAA